MIKDIFRERSVKETAQICKYGIFSTVVATIGIFCAAAMMDAPQHASTPTEIETQQVEQKAHSYNAAKR